MFPKFLLEWKHCYTSRKVKTKLNNIAKSHLEDSRHWDQWAQTIHPNRYDHGLWFNTVVLNWTSGEFMSGRATLTCAASFLILFIFFQLAWLQRKPRCLVSPTLACCGANSSTITSLKTGWLVTRRWRPHPLKGSMEGTLKQSGDSCLTEMLYPCQTSGSIPG